MAQVTDRNIGANPTGFDMRTEINNIIAALESDNSGSSAPLNTVAYMKWLDTSNATYYYYKERNHDNTAWVTLFRYTVATKIIEAVSNGVVLDDSAVVHKTGDETIGGVKTFSSSPIVPNATTATQAMAYGQGVNLTAYQTIAGVKTFASSPIVPTPTTDFQVANKKYVDDSGFSIASSAEAITGTDNTKAITPLRLREGLNASGSAPIYACRAWVNFNGTGTVAIRASGNVSSITDNSTGNYTVNFTTAMPDKDYSVVGFGSFVQAERMGVGGTATMPSSVGIQTAAIGAFADAPEVFVAVYR